MAQDNTLTHQFKTFIGIDVAKDKFDVASSNLPKGKTFAYTKKESNNFFSP